MISTLLGTKLGAALAAGVVSFGAVGAAAYTGSLPAGLQDLAHTTVGAPAAAHGKSADHRPAGSAAKTEKTAVGPDATGHAAFGLCTAWDRAQAHGKAADKSVAFHNLATAAGGANEITTYCAKVPHPGVSPTGEPTTDQAGKPTTDPAGKPTTNPAGRPATHLSGKPANPAGRPTLQPSHSPSSLAASHRP